MNLEKAMTDGVLTVNLEGKLDTGTAPQAEKELEADVLSAQKVVLDMKSLKYLSSAGLRLILKIYKNMKGKDGLIVKNVNENIMEIFELTGFMDILQIE